MGLYEYAAPPPAGRVQKSWRRSDASISASCSNPIICLPPSRSPKMFAWRSTCAGSHRLKAIVKTEEVLASLGLTSKKASFPRQLSGGEQQRVAIARAIVAEPSAILADEPTASLDAANGQAIMTILHAIAKERGRAVLVVTHDPRLFGFADRIVHIEDGSLTREEFTDRQANLMRSSVSRAQ